MYKNILEEIFDYKKKEIQSMQSESENQEKSNRSFYNAIAKKNKIPNLVAEIKPASPIKGHMFSEDQKISDIAKYFETFGADAISVLTDEKYFQGDFKNLSIAKENTKKIPILCKDFIISENQILKARKHGADSFLLIAKILSEKQIQNFLDFGRKYNMEALVEIANEEDLKKISKTDSKIIGINNRNLEDFSVDIKNTFILSNQIKDRKIISLSGFSGNDILIVKNIVNAILVGSSICKQIGNNKEIKNIIYKEFKKFTNPNPLIKLCGIKNKEELKKINKNINFLGLNFVDGKRRKITTTTAKKIIDEKPKAKLVGVFQNQNKDYILDICKKCNLDFIQLSGNESHLEYKNFPYPIIKGISPQPKEELKNKISQWGSVASIFLFDGKNPGSGESFNEETINELQINKPFLIAGGINNKNCIEKIINSKSDGTDLASYIENNKTKLWQKEKIELITKKIQSIKNINKIYIIAAVGKNNEIGKDNKLLWKLKTDMKHFHNTIKHSVIIMGRKTFYSIGRPLSKCINIVITSKNLENNEVITCNNIKNSIKIAKQYNKKIFIIGGEQIYNYFINKSDELIITQVEANFNADTFFPKIQDYKWTEIESVFYKKDENNEYDFYIKRYTRKNEY